MKEYDIVILGVGPAGLQAAIHSSRRKIKVLLMGKPENSSIYKAHIENYCCLNYISGDDLLKQGLNQAKKFGADFLEEDCIETRKDGEWYIVKTEHEEEIKTRALIYTLGVTRNNLNVPGESTLRGHGVSYCVDCDANFFKDKPVAVVGNGSAATSGALTLKKYTKKVYLVSEELQVSNDILEKIKNERIETYTGKKVASIVGNSKVESIELDSGEVLQVDGVFIELGAKGALELAGFLGIEMTENLKHIKTDKQQKTNLPGIFAAGDICGPPWQIAKAVGEGCVAGLEAAQYAKQFK